MGCIWATLFLLGFSHYGPYPILGPIGFYFLSFGFSHYGPFPILGSIGFIFSHYGPFPIWAQLGSISMIWVILKLTTIPKHPGSKLIKSRTI